jgi:flavodoxin
MKILIAYYSRTGTTRKAAELLAQKLGAELAEIKDTVDRAGVIGYMKSGRDGMKRLLTKLAPLDKSPAEYDLVIVGTPVWAGNMSAPVRTYLTEQKNNIKQAAFFCTMGGQNPSKTFPEMADILGQQPLATLAIRTKEVVKNEFAGKVDEFIKEDWKK